MAHMKIAETAHEEDGLRPNQKTLEAITRLNRGEGRLYSSSDEMFKELDDAAFLDDYKKAVQE